jgi:ABC-type branched-subunit amino acid transport system substrate-binding protein
MKQIGKYFSVLFVLLAVLVLAAYSPLTAAAAKADKPAKADKTAKLDKMAKAEAFFDVNKMSDMSDYDPANPIIPTGDTIKIAVVAAFSGPSAFNGQSYFFIAQWVAHDINKRGGLMVDGKKKLIEVIKADHMSKVDQCKKVTERMALQEKVHFFWGTDGSHFMKIINETANKYKIIAINVPSLSDDLQDATNFSRYAFHSSYSTEQIARGLAYYYGQIRKKEKKFYILNQDYAFGHVLADGFKKGLKEYYPEAQIVGEDFHKLFLTDYAPYLEKIKASGAEVIFTGDWLPDAGNLLKQARQMGLMLPFANVYMDNQNFLNEVGVEGTKGLVNISSYNVPNPFFKSQDEIKFYNVWLDLWKNKWKTSPFNTIAYQHATANGAAWLMQTYWLFSVVERAKSTDPEKVIKVWENDSYRFVNGKVVRMRACDHKAVQDLAIVEYVPPAEQKVSFNIPPYYWFKNASYTGPIYKIPAEKILPWMDQKLDRCAGKNGWGE